MISWFEMFVFQSKVSQSHIDLKPGTNISVDIRWLTFLHGTSGHGFTVCALELVEEWPYFNFIDNALPQTGESYVSV